MIFISPVCIHQELRLQRLKRYIRIVSATKWCVPVPLTPTMPVNTSPTREHITELRVPVPERIRTVQSAVGQYKFDNRVRSRNLPRVHTWYKRVPNRLHTCHMSAHALAKNTPVRCDRNTSAFGDNNSATRWVMRWRMYSVIMRLFKRVWTRHYGVPVRAK